jgi:hypothetical protein
VVPVDELPAAADLAHLDVVDVERGVEGDEVVVVGGHELRELGRPRHVLAVAAVHRAHVRLHAVPDLDVVGLAAYQDALHEVGRAAVHR